MGMLVVTGIPDNQKEVILKSDMGKLLIPLLKGEYIYIGSGCVFRARTLQQVAALDRY